ncbi:hypothetical protein MG293_004777 [Ovis ammon polii]|uniref:Uncharacterized protein n=1 Tax=Ovis ammon polii TaxID=230172 RepID=A0AAD4YFB1_OVIAM|nr:hypothetical protein MG293_004777 [Ovis ammon polii]
MVQRVFAKRKTSLQEGYGSEQNSRFWINKKYEIGRPGGHIGIQLIDEVKQIQKSNTFLRMGHETLLTGVVGEYGWDPAALIIYRTAFRRVRPVLLRELDEKPIAARCTCLIAGSWKRKGRHQKDDLD